VRERGRERAVQGQLEKRLLLRSAAPGGGFGGCQCGRQGLGLQTTTVSCGVCGGGLGGGPLPPASNSLAQTTRDPGKGVSISQRRPPEQQQLSWTLGRGLCGLDQDLPQMQNKQVRTQSHQAHQIFSTEGDREGCGLHCATAHWDKSWGVAFT
jgi:hypothetical protein